MQATAVAMWLSVLVCALAAAPAPARAASTEGRLVTQQDGAAIDVPLEHTEVALRVDGFLAHATVTQRFRNPYPVKIEAVYLFPLPTSAAVDGMTIVSGNRTIRGTIRERGAATAAYVEARGRGQIAALLAQERPNLFTQSVANLEPSAVIEVTITYVQPLPYQDGGYELVFPMVAGPRHVPGSASAAARAQAPAVQPAVLPPGVRSSHDLGLRVELDAGVPIEAIESPSHRLAIDHRGPRATVRLAAGDTIPNKDFVLRYRVAGTAPRFGVLAHRDGTGPGHFLLIAQPPAAPPPEQIAPRELVLVLDTSSSMRGAPLAKAKHVIHQLLQSMRPDDTFQIVRFDDRATPLGPAPIANKPRNVRLVLEWLAQVEAGGGTDLTTGIDAALAVPHDPLRLRLVVFLTDGYIGNEDEVLRDTAAKLRDGRLFAFGVGTAVNRYLLEELAAVGRGALQVVRPDEDTAAAVAAFHRRLDAPVLTDVRIDWGGLAVTDVAPRAIPDLFAGQPLVLAGRYTAPGAATVTVRGRQAGRDVAFQIPVALPAADAARPAIGTVWARQRIAELSRRLVRAPDSAAEREILTLSLEHKLLTQQSAFVAIDETRATPGGAPARVVVPVEVPEAARAIAYSRTTIASAGYGTIGYGSGSGAGYGAVSAGLLGSTAARPLIVISGAPRVAGELDKTIVQRYVQRQKERITYCYERRLLAVPGLAGTATATFVIHPSGAVLSVVVRGLGDDEVEQCISKTILAIEFPRTENGKPIEINYPFTFKPSGGTP